MKPNPKEKPGTRNIEVAVRMRPILHTFENDQVWDTNA